MQLRHKVPLLVIGAASAIFGLVNYVAYRSQVAYIDAFKADQLHDIASEISNGISGLARASSMYAELVTTLPSVREALAAKDRASLAMELAPSFRNSRAKYQAEGGAFYSPEVKTFLRLLRVDLFGDDVSHRPMVVRALQSQKSQSGLEPTISRVGVRGVVPVTSNGVTTGAFEWGLGFSRLLQRVKENSDADVALLVDERCFTAPITSRGQAMKEAAARAAEADRIVEGYRTVETTDVELMKQVVQREVLAQANEITFRTKFVNGVEHGVIAVPISDYRGNRLGAIWIAKSMAEPQRAIRATKLTFLTATVIGLILLAGAVQLVFNGLLLRPLVEVGDLVDAVTKGDVNVKVDLKKRTDEIGIVARSFDRYRDRLAQEKDAADRADKISARLKKLEHAEGEEKK